MMEDRIIKVQHNTSYKYTSPVLQSQNSGHFFPASFADQNLLLQTLRCDPIPVEQTQRLDYFGNPLSLFSIDDSHTHFDTSIELIILKKEMAPAISSISTNEALNCFKHKVHELPKECWAHINHTTLTPVIDELSNEFHHILMSHSDFYEACKSLMTHVNKTFTFDGQFSDVCTPLSEIYKERRGVCQDFTHIMLSGFRSLGIPSRYISGYIETLPPEGQEKLVGADASHAWVSVFVPGYGWLDLDPTNNMELSMQHISLARGRDYNDVTPLKGAFVGSSEHQLKVSVDVREISAEEAGEKGIYLD